MVSILLCQCCPQNVIASSGLWPNQGDANAPLSGLLDGVWYKYYIHANDNGWVAFWIEDLWGNEIDQGYYPAVQVPFYFSDNGNTEIWIAAPIAGSTGPWSVIFYDIQHGWF
jgi:hypothetical protein